MHLARPPWTTQQQLRQGEKLEGRSNAQKMKDDYWNEGKNET